MEGVADGGGVMLPPQAPAKMEVDQSFAGSPFLHSGTHARASSFAILHLRRDQLLPVKLQDSSAGDDGYGVGAVTNTRFGSYPHSTLVDAPWGTQVLASQVDTGSRGRKGPSTGQKRKAPDGVDNADIENPKKPKIECAEDGAARDQKQSMKSATVVAPTGFCHVLPPTPEAWTVSLPHRTQVVYTPDYSFILQKIRARPGSVMLEAGAGSGSMTHAAARAVFSGYPQTGADGTDKTSTSKYGKVYSFEYHEARAKQLQVEIEEHGIASVVQVTHRDVYNDGFLVPDVNAGTSNSTTTTSPLATQVFLDLPAPWQALPHLTRSTNGPLDPKQPAHICIFLPCIEQVQRAATALRAHGWVEINMQELQQRRIEVRRERIGLDLQGLRSVTAAPSSFEEAVERLKEVEKNGRRYQNIMLEKAGKPGLPTDLQTNGDDGDASSATQTTKKADRLAKNAEAAASRKTYKEGRLVHRTEPDVRTHTSYLIFAVLPMEWTKEDEARCQASWPIKEKQADVVNGK